MLLNATYKLERTTYLSFQIAKDAFNFQLIPMYLCFCVHENLHNCYAVWCVSPAVSRAFLTPKICAPVLRASIPTHLALICAVSGLIDICDLCVSANIAGILYAVVH